MNYRLLPVIILLAAVLGTCVFGQKNDSAESAKTPSSEMERLARFFVGDWDTNETMERSDDFPNGGSRKGISHWRLGVGGTTLVGEGFSDGSVGPLDHLIVIWWDKKTKLYGYFVCFKDTGSSCLERGAAHWEGNNFVNDYDEEDHGKKVKWRDSFIEITPNSHTLIAAQQQPDGTMKTLITTHSKRR